VSVGGSATDTDVIVHLRCCFWFDAAMFHQIRTDLRPRITPPTANPAEIPAARAHGRRRSDGFGHASPKPASISSMTATSAARACGPAAVTVTV
jgi:hypothetical protein